jgi:hypothetical protein
VLPPLRVAVTSAVRHVGTADFSGYLRLVDLETRSVTLKASVPESPRRADDPNPRGGLRGARGVSSHGDRLVIANSERIFVFDPDWSLVGEFTHPLMGAVHDVLADENGIWVACTACDLLLQFDWSGEPGKMWSWRSEPELAAALGFESPPPFDPQLDHRDPRVAQQGAHNLVHLNGIARLGDDLLLSFGRIVNPATVTWRLRKAALARIAARLGIARPLPTGPTPVPASAVPGSSHAIVLLPREGRPRLLLHRSGVAVPNHNVDMCDGALVYLDSNTGRFVVWDTASLSERLSVPIPGSPGFARGLLRIGERLYLVGSQDPLAIYVIDVDKRQVVASLELDGIANESVYGLSLVSDQFKSTPRAEALFGSPIDARLRPPKARSSPPSIAT